MTKEAVPIYQVKSIKDFTDYLTNDNTPDTVLFRGQAEDLPLVPKIGRLDVDRPVRKAEKAILEMFQQQSLPFLERVPASEWEWLAIASWRSYAPPRLDPQSTSRLMVYRCQSTENETQWCCLGIQTRRRRFCEHYP